MTPHSALLVTLLVCVGIMAGVWIGYQLFHPDNWS
jgi:hypothetical protein